MTETKLEAWMNQLIARGLAQYPYKQQSARSLDELWQSILDNTVDIKPGEPSTLARLREDRDRYRLS